MYRKIVLEPLTRELVHEVHPGETIKKTKRKLDIKKSKVKPIDRSKNRREMVLKKPTMDNNRIKHKNLYKKIGSISPIFKGQTVYIIGGGPSLKGFDFNRLDGKNVIAVNKAFLFYPNAQAMYWTDARFYDWYTNEIHEFKGLKVTNKTKPVRADIINLQDTGRNGLDLNPSMLRHGNNSGYAAINLAVHFGASTIVLLGYDLTATTNNVHFHDGYGVKQKPGVYQNNMLPYFQNLVEPLKELNIRVINASPKSALNHWYKCTIDEAMNI